MSYEPLHHKYRPQTFANLVGQAAITRTLIHAIESQRIAPAYLFTGPRGTGKTSSARILAKSLNCLNHPQPTPQPCGQCHICREITGGLALDVTEIDAASNTGVDNIRDLIEKAQFAPVQCRYKVYIIDEVHMLSTAAFNALLKTLEEPPKAVVFILATTDPQRVLPTIISRCQRFDFRRIPLDAMVEHLAEIARKETIHITGEAITLVAQIAQGGLRDAESLLDQLSLLPGQVDVEQVWDLVGSVPERDLLKLTQAIASNNSELVIESCRNLMDRGREPLILLQNLAAFYRDLLIVKTAPHRSDLVAVTPPTWKHLCELVQHLNPIDLLHGQQHLKNSEAQIKNTTQPRLWLEITLLGLLPSASHSSKEERNVTSATAQPKQTLTQNLPQNPIRSEPKAHPNQTDPPPKESLEINPNPSSKKEEPAVKVTPTLLQPSHIPEDDRPDTDELFEIWQQVIDQIDLDGTRQLLRDHSTLLQFDGQVARIGIHGKGKFKLIEGTSPLINKAFFKIRKRKVKLTFESWEISQTKTQVTADVRDSLSDSSSPSTETSGNESEKKNSLNASATRTTGTLNPPQNFTYYSPSNRSHNSPLERDSLQPIHDTYHPISSTTILSPSSPIQADIESDSSLTEIPQAEKIASSAADHLRDLEWDTHKVEKALELIQQYFEGDILEWTEDFNLGGSVPSEQPQWQPGIETTTELFNRNSETTKKPLDRIELEWQSQTIIPYKTDEAQLSRDDWPSDETGEPVF